MVVGQAYSPEWVEALRNLAEFLECRGVFRSSFDVQADPSVATTTEYNVSVRSLPELAKLTGAVLEAMRAAGLRPTRTETDTNTDPTRTAYEFVLMLHGLAQQYWDMEVPLQWSTKPGEYLALFEAAIGRDGERRRSSGGPKGRRAARKHGPNLGKRLKREAYYDLVVAYVKENPDKWSTLKELKECLAKDKRFTVSKSTLSRYLTGAHLSHRRGHPRRAYRGSREAVASESTDSAGLTDLDTYTMPDDDE